jgi:hypothetical protein
MFRPKLEVADIFRDHAWRADNARHVSLDQLKVIGERYQSTAATNKTRRMCGEDAASALERHCLQSLILP